MRRLVIIICIIAGVCFPAHIQAGERLYLEQISVSENLPHTDVNAIVEDDEGFIWFATFAGLCRYDGTGMQVYNVTNSLLRSSRIKSLYLDKDGMLYIGTETGGLTLFDTKQDRFVTTLPVPMNNINGIFGHEGKICLCTDAGVTSLEISDGQYNMDSHRISRGVMGGCSIPGKGMVLCSPSGLYFYEDGADGMGTSAIRTVMTGSHCMSCVYLADKDMLMVAGYDGCHTVDCRTWQVQRINTTETISLYEAPDGNIWAGTRKEGIICFGRDLSVRYRYGPYEEYGSNSCDITSFFMDSSSVLWIGTIGNGCYKKISHTDDFHLYSIYDGLQKDHIVCMYTDSSDRLWISARDGSLYVMEGKRITRVDQRSLSGFENMPISFIYEDVNGALWIGAWTHGIKVISKNDIGAAAAGRRFSFRHFALTPLLNAASVYTADPDASGNIWLSTNYGVFRYAPGKEPGQSIDCKWYNGNWTNFSSSPSDTCSLSDNFCTDILAESNGGKQYVWVGSRFGLTRFICDNKGNVLSIRRISPSQEDSGLSGDYVSVIHKDKNGDLWTVTLGGGLNKLINSRDSARLRFRHYNSRNASFLSNELESLQEDSSGVFWIGSSRGLTRFDPRSGEIKTFSKKDGLQSDVFKIWASGKFSDGRMVFGGPEGFNIFDPTGISRNTIPPKTVVTGLDINGHEIFPGDTLRGKVILEKPLRHLTGIMLPYDCNSLTFRFAALHYEHPEMNRYRFMLEGVDNVWRYTGQRDNSATYLNLKPGRYTFCVFGSNSDGIWCTDPARLAVTIRPPLWRSAAAYILYCIVFIFIVYLVRTALVRRNRQHYQLEMEHKLRLEEEQRNENELKFHTDFLHEIKTPLTLITAPVNELLDSTNLGKTTRDRLQLVKRSTMILQRLLDRVTDLRKYDNGHIHLHVVEVDFCRFVEETVMLFVPYMKSKGISFSFEKPDSPVMVYIDKAEMEKVVMNLMSNAIRYSPEKGGGTIKATIATDDSAGYPGVMLSVSNTGIGILPEDLTRIFERFRQGTNNNAHKGMGIGLAISKHVVSLHGGEIYAESVPGKETVFHVRLRLGDSHFSEDVIDRAYSNSDDVSNYDKLPETAYDLAARYAGTGEKTYTVLIADDSPELRNYLQQLLSMHYNVICASDGREGYEKAIADQPDIIISDVVMPEMDGMELCQRIKGNPDTSHIPVILLSARNLPVDKIEGFEALADEYMTKPFQSEVLLSRIDNLIRQRESMREAFRKNILLEPSAVTGTTSDERFVKTVISAIEEHMPEPEFGIDELCKEIGISRPTLYRRIKSLTGMSAIRFLRSIRLKRAAQLLDSDDGLPVSSVMYQTGFSNMSYFSRIFFEEFHILPKDYHDREDKI